MDMKASVTRRTGSNNAAAAVDRSSRIEVGHTRLPVGHSLLLKAEAPRPIEAAGIQTLKQRSSDLRSRLGRFLPQLAAANAAVKERVATEGIASVDIEAVDEEEQHIEMNVALTEMADGAGSSSSNSSDSESDGGDDGGKHEADGGAGAAASSSSSSSAAGAASLGRQLRTKGKRKGGKKPRIEVIGGVDTDADEAGGAGLDGVPRTGPDAAAGAEADEAEEDEDDDGDGRWITSENELRKHKQAIIEAILADAARARQDQQQAGAADDDDAVGAGR